MSIDRQKKKKKENHSVDDDDVDFTLNCSPVILRCVPPQLHVLDVLLILIQLISSLVENERPEMHVSNKCDIQCAVVGEL